MKETILRRTVDVEDVKKRILSGEIYKSIGESYGVTKQAIAKIAKKEGLAGTGIAVRQRLRAEKAGFKTHDDLIDFREATKLETFLQKCGKFLKSMV